MRVIKTMNTVGDNIQPIHVGANVVIEGTQYQRRGAKTLEKVEISCVYTYLQIDQYIEIETESCQIQL